MFSRKPSYCLATVLNHNILQVSLEWYLSHELADKGADSGGGVCWGRLLGKEKVKVDTISQYFTR